MIRFAIVLLAAAAATAAVADRIDLIKLRAGTSAEWSAANPVLDNGEPGFDKTIGSLKIGDGATAWSSLSWPFLRDSDITSGTLTPATGNIDLSGGTDGQALLYDGSGNVAPGDVATVMSTSTQTITTSDFNVSVNTEYLLDIDGMTAERSLIIPAGNADGDIITWKLTTDAPATQGHELTIKGATGVTISWFGEDATAAVDNRFRFLLAGESGKLTWDANAGKWRYCKCTDGRIPLAARIHASGCTNQPVSDGVWTIAGGSLLCNMFFERGNVGDTANGRLLFRRSGLYLFSASFQSGGSITGVGRVVADTADGKVFILSPKYYVENDQAGGYMSALAEVDVTTDDYVRMQMRLAGDSDQAASAVSTFIEYAEQL